MHCVFYDQGDRGINTDALYGLAVVFATEQVVDDPAPIKPCIGKDGLDVLKWVSIGRVEFLMLVVIDQKLAVGFNCRWAVKLIENFVLQALGDANDLPVFGMAKKKIYIPIGSVGTDL